MAEKLEFILAIELLSTYQSQQFVDPEVPRAPATAAVLRAIAEHIPPMERDVLLHPYIQYLKDWIHSGELLRTVENVIDPLN